MKMKFQISEDQIFFFRRDGKLLLEEYFSSSFYLNKYMTLSDQASCNLRRKDHNLCKILCHNRLGHVLFQLTGERPIRLLCDQVVMSSEEIDIQQVPFFGVLIGLALPVATSSLIIFSPRHSLCVKGAFLFVVYGFHDTRYRYMTNPLSYSLRGLGYESGDLLKGDDFPFVFR